MADDLTSLTPAESSLLSIKVTAQIIGVCTKTIYRYIREGKLSAIRVGGRLLRIQQSHLSAFLSNTK